MLSHLVIDACEVSELVGDHRVVLAEFGFDDFDDLQLEGHGLFELARGVVETGEIADRATVFPVFLAEFFFEYLDVFQVERFGLFGPFGGDEDRRKVILYDCEFGMLFSDFFGEYFAAFEEGGFRLLVFFTLVVQGAEVVENGGGFEVLPPNLARYIQRARL